MIGRWRHLGFWAAFALATAASPAHATATLTCDVDRPDFVFHVRAAVGNEALTLSGLRGELHLPTRGVAVELDGGDLMQTWIDGDDLRLRFHLFAGDDRPELDLTVVTRSRGPTTYTGRYRLRIGEGSGAHPRRGDVACVVG